MQQRIRILQISSLETLIIQGLWGIFISMVLCILEIKEKEVVEKVTKWYNKCHQML